MSTTEHKGNARTIVGENERGDEMASIQVASLQRGSLGRRVVLLGTPAVLVLVELGHPLLDHEHTISMLASINTWWIILHVLLIPLFALMGWAFFLLLQG